MRKQMLVILLLVIISDFSKAQNKKTAPDKATAGRYSFIAEGGGAGIAFSANFDTRFKNSRLGLGGRLGVGFVSAWADYYDPVLMMWTEDDQESAITFPVQLNYVFGKNNSPHTFEAGAGCTYVSKKLNIMNFASYYNSNSDRRTQFFGTFAFMYRRQPLNGGFSWRAGFTPIFAKDYIQPFGSLSVGYNF
ncbi:MAG: hypothetical protein HOP10_01575 [Chitinophagaceae bacterium]|nr:hypothetical protein [Chitinophagaceae bacterium]